MSLAEIERFATDLKSNAALRAAAELSQSDKSHATAVERSMAFAESKGYSFTIEEAWQFAKEKAASKGKVLTDAELDGVAGGSSCFLGFIISVFTPGG
jgi:hypothetical protein